MLNKLKPYLVGALAAITLLGGIYLGGKVHYYYRVLNRTEHILIDSHVAF